jgi:hypothetical protein
MYFISFNFKIKKKEADLQEYFHSDISDREPLTLNLGCIA